MIAMPDEPRLETERLDLVRPEEEVEWPGFRALFASDRSRFVGGLLPDCRAWTVFRHPAPGDVL